MFVISHFWFSILVMELSLILDGMNFELPFIYIDKAFFVTYFTSFDQNGLKLLY